MQKDSKHPAPAPFSPPRLRAPGTAALGPALAALLLAGVLGGCSSGESSSSSTPSPAPVPSPSGSVTPQSNRTTLGLANSGCTQRYNSAPRVVRSGADPMLARQWHLQNDGRTGIAGGDLNVTSAWQSTRGEGVRVAVIDDAIELLHEDLQPNALLTGSYDYRTASRGGMYPLPCTSNDYHGTSVAGLIAARDDNGVGGAGVAPRATLVGFNALTTGADADVADALNRDLALNQIYNNSWGADDDGRTHPAEASYQAAVATGVRTGREGKGSLYFFPSGNGGCYDKDLTGACTQNRDNSNADGYANNPHVMTICAVGPDGKLPYYGEMGANILSCAVSSSSLPGSGITTTAIGNTYTDSFDGTSASTPMMSGVAALMLAANPSLTWRDVRLILARASRRNDPADAGWVTGPSGLYFNHKYGFGTIDAQQAVTLARTWTSVGGSSSLKTCTAEQTVGRPLPDPVGAGQPVASSLAIAGCGITRIEFVQVTFEAGRPGALTGGHPSGGDLDISLDSPSSTRSLLAEPHTCADPFSGASLNCATYENWTFGSVRHMDEPANGSWTLNVIDRNPNQLTGTFVKWKLTLMGR